MAKSRPTRKTGDVAAPLVSKLVDQFAFSKCVEDLPTLRTEILARIPDATDSSKSIADPGEVDRVFNDLRRKLDEGIQQDRYARSMAFREPLSRIAQWERLVHGIAQLRALQASEGDAITAFIRFATKALHLTNDALSWFPDVDAEQPEACWATAPEREALASVVSPGGVTTFHETLYARAVASARERGEAPFALPKLERIEKGLTRLGEILRDGSTTNLIGTDVGQEIGAAICHALVLIQVDSKKAHPLATNADEAVLLNGGRRNATVRELMALTGLTEYQIRGKVRRALNGELPEGVDFPKSDNVFLIANAGPGQPKTEYRITGIWPVLFRPVEKKIEP
jgi:hypothetical protein